MRRRLDLSDLDPALEASARHVVEACGEVRRELGSGLMESVDLECLAEELRARGLAVAVEVPMLIAYKGRTLEERFRVDMLVDERIVVEARAVEELHPVHVAPLLTYLRLSGKPLGFLVNFHAVPMSAGIRRFVDTRG